MKKFLYVITILLISTICILTAIKYKDINNYIFFKNPVRIVLITDNKYVRQTRTVIRSINANKSKKTNIEVNVIGVGLSEKDIKKIKSESKLKTKIKVIDLPGGSNQNPDVTRADYAKFKLCSIFPNTEKILYLDGDIIVLKDLSQLYNTDIENYYIASVDDLECGWIDYREERYFNNGVMLLNLKKMREDNIEEKLIDYKKNDKINRLMTQDAFNAVLYKKVKFLPIIYDTFAQEFNDKYILEILKIVLKNNFDEKLYPYKTAEEYKNAVVIIHYTGTYNVKPWFDWADKNSESSKIWYKYAPKE